MDFSKVCRTCLNEASNFKGLFSEEYISEKHFKLSELLHACTSIEIQDNDTLPKQVCTQCVHSLLSLFSFQEQCLKSDYMLKALISERLENQLTNLKPLGIDNTSSSDKIDEIAINSSLHNDILENNASNQELALDTKNPEDHNFHELSNDSVENEENSLNNLLAIKEKVIANDIKDTDDCVIKSESVKPQTELNRTKEEIDILDIRTQEYELESDYIITDNELKILKLEKNNTVESKNNDDETTLPLFPCDQNGCVACFTAENDLKKHIKSHQPAHFCALCNQTFSSSSTLSRHVKSKHQEGNKGHLCSDCGKGFGRSDDLKRHLRTHTGERPFRCDKCGKAFAQSFRLLEHIRAHSKEKNFICAKCGKAFSRYTSLLAHNKTHSDIKTHECKECGKKLRGASSLAMHMKTHTGEKDFICNFCGKAFAFPSSLTIHKRLHTGEKPYVCTSCDKAFADQSRLNVHKRTHSGEKPYVCKYCNRGCVSNTQLIRHVRIHTEEKPYECDLCQKRFYRREDLKTHIKVHKGERNHTCEICHKGFYQASTLKVHMRIHTGEKPYTCKICDASFAQTGPFSIHMKKHEKEKCNPQEAESEDTKIIQYL